MTPETLALEARRNVPFKEAYAFTESGEPVDLTGCSGAMHVRQYGAAADPANIALADVTEDIEGVWIMDPEGGEVQVSIDQATLEAVYDALIGNNEPGTSIELVYDLVITWADNFAETFLEGTFTIQPGVTD